MKPEDRWILQCQNLFTHSETKTDAISYLVQKSKIKKSFQVNHSHFNKGSIA